MLTIWHNPRCSKSRQTLALIEAAGQSAKVRLYLEDTPDVAELTRALEELGLSDPRDLMRRGEAIYKEQGLKDIREPAALLRAMAKNPKLIERPVVSNGTRAVIGRPPDAVKTLF